MHRGAGRERRENRKSGGKIRLLLMGGGSLCVLIFCVFGLVRYLRDARVSTAGQEEFQALYYSGTDQREVAQRNPVMRQFTVEIPRSGEAAGNGEQRTAAPVVKDWPGNPYRIASDRFQKLLQRNKDIIGWLTIPDMLDQAVVQRDNSYYLKRDYLGNRNGNGALFLEEGISMYSRPDTYIIFGHNMKTGDMFGSLRLYENAGYYRQHAVIDFDVLYEEGQYVIFSVADVSILRGLARYVPFMQLPGMEGEAREKCIRQLRDWSYIYTAVDVKAEDQLLLLVTCEGPDENRRIVAARRLREGETVEDVERVVKYAKGQ